MSLGIVLFVTVLVLFGMMVGFAYLTRFLVESMVGTKHRVLDEIVSTGQVPQKWRDRYARRVSGSAHGGTFFGRSREAREAARIRRRLARLSRYVAGTGLVADENARRDALDALESVSRRWQREAEE